MGVLHAFVLVRTVRGMEEERWFFDVLAKDGHGCTDGASDTHCNTILFLRYAFAISDVEAEDDTSSQE